MDIQICQRHWKTDKLTDRWETHITKITKITNLEIDRQTDELIGYQWMDK